MIISIVALLHESFHVWTLRGFLLKSGKWIAYNIIIYDV